MDYPLPIEAFNSPLHFKENPGWIRCNELVLRIGFGSFYGVYKRIDIYSK
jgi:hypothetical protein